MKHTFSALVGIFFILQFFSMGIGSVSAQGLIIDNQLLPKRKIIVGGDENYPPYTFLDKSGNPQGLDVDVIKSLAKEMDFEIEFKFSQWKVATESLENGKIDMILGIMYSNKRSLVYDYTIPHTTEHHAVFVRKDSGINDISDLSGKILIIQKGDLSFKTVFKPLGFDNKTVESESVPQAIKMLNDGQHDFFIVTYSIGMQARENLENDNLKVIGPPIIPSIYRFAVKKGDRPLLTVLNEGLDKLKAQNKIEPIQKKWKRYIRNDLTAERVIRYATFILIPLVILIFALFLWSWTLKKEVLKNSRKLVKAKKEAEKANLAKSDFMAKLSHEIRTPLNSIIGVSQILKDQKGKDIQQDEVSRHIKNMELSSSSLLMLVNDVLDLSRIEAGKIEINITNTNIRELLEDLYGLARDQALEQGIILNYSCDMKIPDIIQSDTNLLMKIVRNLLSNSIKFTPSGKNIWLKAKLEENLLVLEVEDEGIGIHPEQLNKVFEPFEQVGKAVDKSKGSGLGLAIVNENVKTLGGTVNVTSQINKGSTFSVELPIN